MLILRDIVRILCIFFFSLLFRYIYLLYMALVTILTYIVLIFFIYWCMFFHLSLHMLFIFSLYAHASYTLYAIYYFCFTLRCLDEFCLKCFRNTGCQSLLAINSFLAKFFKSLCYDRFYCIKKVSISWVIYDFSHMFICLLWFCHGLPNGKIVRTYVFHMLGTYVAILCNWLILWQNALYLYLGRSRMCLMFQEIRFQVQVLKPCKSVQESSVKNVVH